MAEIFCRVPVGGSNCGRKHSNLKVHLSSTHNIKCKASDFGGAGPPLSVVLRASIKFYVEVMKSANYVGKGGPLETDIDNMSLNLQSCLNLQAAARSRRAVHNDDLISDTESGRRQRRISESPEAQSEAHGRVEDESVASAVKRRIHMPTTSTAQMKEAVPLLQGGAQQGEAECRKQKTSTRKRSIVSNHQEEAEHHKQKKRHYRGDVLDDSDEGVGSDDGDDVEIQAKLENLRIQREIKQIELEEVQLKQKLAARKKNRTV